MPCKCGSFRNLVTEEGPFNFEYTQAFESEKQRGEGEQVYVGVNPMHPCPKQTNKQTKPTSKQSCHYEQPAGTFQGFSSHSLDEGAFIVHI